MKKISKKVEIDVYILHCKHPDNLFKESIPFHAPETWSFKYHKLNSGKHKLYNLYGEYINYIGYTLIKLANPYIE